MMQLFLPQSSKFSCAFVEGNNLGGKSGVQPQSFGCILQLR